MITLARTAPSCDKPDSAGVSIVTLEDRVKFRIVDWIVTGCRILSRYVTALRFTFSGDEPCFPNDRDGDRMVTAPQKNCH